MHKRGYPCRCRHCGARRTFRHHPDTYARRFRWLVCCGKADWRVDNYRMTREHKNRCLCDGYWFPHRKGSKWCNFNINYPTEERS